MPSFDFSKSTGRWMPRAPEMAQLLNAHSIVIPHLERFLNRVMARARAAIGEGGSAAEQVRADISMFIKQESCHYTAHGEFNAMMLRSGYDRLPALEQEIQAHYERLLTTKSLPFLVGYCEGFESLTPPIASGWFDGSMDRMTKDADPGPLNMWRWHIMEEFEHRTVCHDAFQLISGSYPLRVYTFGYQLAWFERMVGKVYRHLLEVDRRSMTAEEIQRSRKFARMSTMGFYTPIVKGMARILRPGYSPRAIPEPQGWAATRDAIERDWVKGRAAPA
jgi:uncharacterized protein